MSRTPEFEGHDRERNGTAKPLEIPAILRIQLLGDFCVSAGDGELTSIAWRSRKAAQLVKALALTPDHALHREQVLEMLWPELAPTAAANNLRQTLHLARRTLQPLPIDSSELLRIHDERVLLYPIGHIWIDVEAFESAARAARRSDDPDVYWSVIDRYTAPLLPEDPYEDWAASRRRTLIATYLALLDDVACLHEARGEHSLAQAALRRIVEEEPADEAAHVRLMRLYALTGRRPLALRQYQQLVIALARELDTTPEPATKELFEAIKRGSLSSESSTQTNRVGANSARQARRPATNLYHPLSSFIGREHEVADLCRLIGEHRLVTVTGPGGNGKTRLVVEVGWKEFNRHRDGVWFVDLTALSDPTLLAQTVADALGIQLADRDDPLAALIARLRDRDLLLILDNCEHLITACAHFVLTLLATCAEVRVLATSREALRLRGGRRWLVPPLPLPEADAGLAEIAASDAVRLFIDRIRWHRPEFALSEDNASLVATICRQLEGLPLALELAASSAAVLALPELAQRLANVLDVLVEGARRLPRRQQTLRATLDWSYDLLEPLEQVLFRRLAVFAGGWSLAAAEVVCPDEELASRAVLGLLSQLVQKSLVLVEASGDEARYRLLEPVRQYAIERLRASGEFDAVRGRHAQYFLLLTEEAESHLAGPGQASWLKRVARERDDLRAALVSFEKCGDRGSALRLAAGLGRFWWVQGYVAEGRQWLTRTLAATSGEYQPARMKALGAAFTMAHRGGDYVAAQSLAEESLALAQRHGDERDVAWSLAYLGMVAAETGGDQLNLFHESLTLFRAVDDRAGIAEVLNMLGEAKRLQGDFGDATELYEESLALWRELGDEQYVATILHNLGRVAQRLGDSQRAATLLVDSLTLFQNLQINNGVALCLRGLAGVAVGIGRLETAARFLGAAETLAERAGVVEDTADREQSQSALAAARAGLGEAHFAAAWSAGKSLSVDAAIEDALAFGDADPLPYLTPGEQKVACLVARGLTNGQIAAELGVAARTIDTHVSHILHKLGVPSRHDIADQLSDTDAADR
ncbi:MAG TPA: tetratricopeptide repeat protein [Nitrolancea sp.]|nr:tetratricopeptide repeat protein [Nitrolancea sp.]